MARNPFARLFFAAVRRLLPQMTSTSLKDLAGRYEDELVGSKFVYTFQEKGHKPFRVPIEFEPSGFCHLMSVGSMVKDVTPDLDEFSGMKGWRNIQNGKITLSLLRKLDPAQFNYYQNEYQMFDQMIETVRNPQAVRFDVKKVPGSKLKSDILLYNIYGNRTIHIGLSQGSDGDWFVRSYFVRENNRDKQYPTKYIANMQPLSVRVKESSKKA